MAPPQAIYSEPAANGNSDDHKVANAPLEPGLSKHKAQRESMAFPKPPKFETKEEEQWYLKQTLAAAFRIFGKYGFDEGVAGHITCRV